MSGAARVPEHEPRIGSSEAIALGLIVFVALVAFWPLLRVGLVTNDDLKLGNAALDRGARGVAAVLWAFTRRDGRLDIAQMLSWYLPFAVDSFVWFKLVSLAGIAADFVLFALLVRSVFGGHASALLALLLCAACLQNSWEHNPLVAFPGLFTFSLAYLLGALLAFQRFLATGRLRFCIASALLYLVALCSYEMYLLYAPVFVALAMGAGRRAVDALRTTALHVAAAATYLGMWAASHALRTGNYPGVTVAPGVSLAAIAHVVWRFSVSSLPTSLFFSEKYDVLLQVSNLASGWEGLAASFGPASAMKALATVVAFVVLVRRMSAEAQTARGARLLFAGLGGGIYFLAPNVLPALTERYQGEARHQLGMQCSYFSWLAWAWLTVCIVAALAGGGRRSAWRRALLAVVGGAVVCAGLVVDYTNAAVGEWQSVGSDRFAVLNRFIASGDYAAIPDGSYVYAPSLWASTGTLSFVGTAIDPRPSMDPRYENYWTFYFARRTGKRVIVADRLERIPQTVPAFYYLKCAELPHHRGQNLVFANVTRAPGHALLLSDRVMLYDRSDWPNRVVGGSVATAGAPIDVTLVGVGGGETMSTDDAFLFEIGTRYSDEGPYRRSAVATVGRAIDVESVYFLPGSLPPPSAIAKTAGWLRDGWIAAQATAALEPRGPARLVIDAYAPDYVFKQLGVSELTLSVEIDHATAVTRRVTRGGMFRLEANVPGTSQLDLRCGPLHRPRAAGFADDRELCVVIDKLMLRRREPGE